MAIISSVLKLVNVGGAVNVDEEKNKKEEKSMFSSDSEEVSSSQDINVVSIQPVCVSDVIMQYTINCIIYIAFVSFEHTPAKKRRKYELLYDYKIFLCIVYQAAIENLFITKYINLFFKCPM